MSLYWYEVIIARFIKMLSYLANDLLLCPQDISVHNSLNIPKAKDSQVWFWDNQEKTLIFFIFPIFFYFHVKEHKHANLDHIALFNFTKIWATDDKFVSKNLVQMWFYDKKYLRQMVVSAKNWHFDKIIYYFNCLIVLKQNVMLQLYNNCCC